MRHFLDQSESYMCPIRPVILGPTGDDDPGRVMPDLPEGSEVPDLSTDGICTERCRARPRFLIYMFAPPYFTHTFPLMHLAHGSDTIILSQSIPSSLCHSAYLVYLPNSMSFSKWKTVETSPTYEATPVPTNTNRIAVNLILRLAGASQVTSPVEFTASSVATPLQYLIPRTMNTSHAWRRSMPSLTSPPIARLFPELLATVLQWSMSTIEHCYPGAGTGSISCRRGQFRLVSRRWNEVILSTPTFWSHIDVDITKLADEESFSRQMLGIQFCVDLGRNVKRSLHIQPLDPFNRLYVGMGDNDYLLKMVKFIATVSGWSQIHVWATVDLAFLQALFKCSTPLTPNVWDDLEVLHLEEVRDACDGKGSVISTNTCPHFPTLSAIVCSPVRAPCLLNTMALRRLAQENAASDGSPKLPKTPRNRVSIGVYRSPVIGPSLSASVPFDWEAARSLATPPYGTPLQRKARKSMGAALDTPSKGSRKAVVRKKSLWRRMNDLPSTIAFHMSMFPQNLPLPSPQTSSRLIAGTMHLAHLVLRVKQARETSHWDDIYVEEDDTWIDWSTLTSLILIGVAFANAAYLFTRTRKYHFMRKQEPLTSPNAKFVSKDWDQEDTAPKPLWKRGLRLTWQAFAYSWRFLFNISPPQSSPSSTNPFSPSKIQELDVWTPGDLELQLFSLYSPVHAFLWIATNSANWIAMMFSMGLLTIMLNALIFTYQALIKDKELIASEVLSEYNDKFVYPRLNPIRHDVGVMTHESECVNLY
ncbi:hypothetical protein NMY22_g18169 [Coprinellus aureogranulatus]|nr:hypothetical protein NMY22_g18169 [Coprinellus aureogranulatus]